MTFDREPDLDNANVGMPELRFRNNEVLIGSYQVGSFFLIVKYKLIGTGACVTG